MKTDEKVLMEWLTNRIMFRIGDRKFFSQTTFAMLTKVLCKRLFSIDAADLIESSGWLIINELVVRNDKYRSKKIETVCKLMGYQVNQHLHDPRQIARFESLDELYKHLSEKNQKTLEEAKKISDQIGWKSQNEV